MFEIFKSIVSPLLKSTFVLAVAFHISNAAAMDMRTKVPTNGPEGARWYGSYRHKFLAAVNRAKLLCGDRAQMVNASFAAPEADETKDYIPNAVQNILYPTKMAFLKFLKEGEKKFYIREFKKLAHYLASLRTLDPTPHQFVCRASCMIGQLMNYSDTDNTAYLLMSEALKFGFGKCTHFSDSLEFLLSAAAFDGENAIEEEPYVINSFKHSFIAVRIWDQNYYFEPQQDGRVGCNFFPAD